MATIGCTVFDNKILRNKRLSLKARGLFAFMWSQAAMFSFTVDKIVEATGAKEKTVKEALKELEKYHYVLEVKKHNTNGDYIGSEYVFDAICY